MSNFSERTWPPGQCPTTVAGLVSRSRRFLAGTSDIQVLPFQDRKPQIRLWIESACVCFEGRGPRAQSPVFVAGTPRSYRASFCLEIGTGFHWTSNHTQHYGLSAGGSESLRKDGIVSNSTGSKKRKSKSRKLLEQGAEHDQVVLQQVVLLKNIATWTSSAPQPAADRTLSSKPYGPDLCASGCTTSACPIGPTPSNMRTTHRRRQPRNLEPLPTANVAAGQHVHKSRHSEPGLNPQRQSPTACKALTPFSRTPGEEETEASCRPTDCSRLAAVL